MAGRPLVCVALAVLLAAPLASAGLLVSPSGAPIQEERRPSDPVRALLERWTVVEPAGGAPSAMAGLASSALDLAELVSGPDVSPRAVLDHVESLSRAQAEATRALTGVAVRAPGDRPDAFDVAREALALADASADGPSLVEALEGTERIARLMSGGEYELPVSVDALGWLASGEAGKDVRETVLKALDTVPGPEPTHELPEMERFDSLHEAMEALFDALGRTIGEEERAELAKLEGLPPDTDAALARIVEAYLLELDATRMAFDGADLSGAFSHNGTRGITYDLGILTRARRNVAEVVLGELDLAPHMAPPSQVCGVYAFDLVGSDSSYDCDVAVLIDLAGNDSYANNAGGAEGERLVPDEAIFVVAPRAALLVDLGGNDQYLGGGQGWRAFAGGGWWDPVFFSTLGATTPTPWWSNRRRAPRGGPPRAPGPAARCWARGFSPTWPATIPSG